jgi:hypothetical protein
MGWSPGVRAKRLRQTPCACYMQQRRVAQLDQVHTQRGTTGLLRFINQVSRQIQAGRRASKSPSLTGLTPKSTPIVGMYRLTNLPSQYLRLEREGP